MNEKDQNIEKQKLKKLAPTLFSIEKKNNFSTPENYFDRFSEKIENKLLDKKVSSLNEIVKQNNFAHPEGYFEQLSEKIEQKITELPEAKVIAIKKNNIVRIISIAASVAAIFILFLLVNENSTLEKKEIAQVELSLENLTVEDLEEALFYSESSEIIENVEFDEIENVDYQNEINEVDLEITSSEIDEYLSSDYYFDVEY